MLLRVEPSCDGVGDYQQTVGLLDCKSQCLRGMKRKFNRRSNEERCKIAEESFQADKRRADTGAADEDQKGSVPIALHLLINTFCTRTSTDYSVASPKRMVPW